jgi:hypothetical protein
MGGDFRRNTLFNFSVKNRQPSRQIRLVLSTTKFLALFALSSIEVPVNAHLERISCNDIFKNILDYIETGEHTF